MPAQWEKVSDKPRDRGIYRNPSSKSIRVMYQAVELRNGKRVTVQKVESFPAGEYRITLEDGTSKRVGVEAFARDFKAQKDRARKAGKVRDVATEEMTVGEYWARWIERPSDRTGKVRRPTSRGRIEVAWEQHIAPAFGNLPLRSITTSDVLDWHASLTCGEGAKNKAVRTLHSLMASASKEGLRLGNPVDGIKATDAVKAITASEVFTWEQIDHLAKTVDDRYRLMVYLLAYGLRIGEVIGLRRSCVNLKGHVKIQSQVTELNAQLVEGPPKSNNGYRTLELEHLAEELQRHIGQYAQSEADGFVFTSENGKAPIRPNNWRRRVFYPALAEAKLPKINPHALRHRIACDLADEGFTDEQIADWLGDSPATVRLVYRNLMVNNRKRVAAHLAERWEQAGR